MKKRSKPRVNWRKLPDGDRIGYIVVRYDGWFLGHDFVWYPHSTLEQAYVHSPASILERGEWAKVVKYLVWAKYYRNQDITEVQSDEQISFSDFIAEHSTKLNAEFNNQLIE